jgi:hypothetical protein
MDMDQPLYGAILRRAGFVLIAVGVIDIGWMIYCIINRISYSSSLNIFAVVAGILLIRGGLKTAGAIRWLAIVFVSAFVSLIILYPILQPFGLTLAEIRFDTGGMSVSFFFAAVIISLLYWIARELGREPIQVARESAGLKRSSARMPIWCGSGILVLAFVLLRAFQSGETADRAKLEAAKAVGPGYSFHVTSFSINYGGSRKSISAVVAAWNDKEVRNIPVHWEEGD